MADFYDIGKQKKTIEVTISYRIIQLFSEGLYASPNKAIEELVCNAFDEDAHNVHVVLPVDLYSPDASIAVIDDGNSMDYNGLKEHWIIGRSNKISRISISRRKQIGKFGIGKLATYVLANRLTHICKKDGKYYSASMDYQKIPSDSNSGVFETPDKERVEIPFRELTQMEAQQALLPWTSGSKKGYKALKLFGKDAVKHWTVAIMSSLKKDMISNLKPGRLSWVLSTAMPLRDEFKLFVNGDKIESEKVKGVSQKWVIGKDITEDDLETTGIDDLVANKDERISIKSEYKYGLSSNVIGRISGYIELFDDRLDTGKSIDIAGRSNGFFVYVRSRLINEDDGHFGIGSNELSHGTFSRFRGVIYADQLDNELRSSRENVREGELVQNIRNVLKAIFNVARREWSKREEELSPGAKFAKTIKTTPYSLTQKPLVNLLSRAFEGKASPRYLKYPLNLTKKQKDDYINKLYEKEDLIQKTELKELSQEDRVAVFDIESETLLINMFHPFVAHFLDEYEDVKKNLPLELLAMSEVLLEANLYQIDIDEGTVNSIMDLRDELLRTLAKSTRKRNAFLVAQTLLDAAANAKGLEVSIVDAFNSMGFESTWLGGGNKPDGQATAALGVDRDGKPQRYSVSLEAKSKYKEGKKVSNSAVHISAVSRHRDEYKCEHAIVVGPHFPGDGTALDREIQRDRAQTGKTITIITITDLARLVTLRPLKRIGPVEIRNLFTECSMPEDCKKWIDILEEKVTDKPKYREVLEVIWERQNKRPSESIEFGVVAMGLERISIDYTKEYIVKICKALEGMAPEFISCRDNGTVELRQKPEIVLERVKAETAKYPETEAQKSFLKGL
jgi:hypothetical protein